MIIKLGNKIILAMMLALALDILAKCAFFSMNARIYHELPAEAQTPDFLYAAVPVLPVTLLSTAVVLNLNNWVFYYIKIGEMASHVDHKAIKLGELKALNRKRMILNGVTIAAIFVILFTFAVVCYHSLNGDIIETQDKIGFNFLILGVAFGITGLMTNMRLKHYFSEFYFENRKMLILATVGLSFPLMLRGCFDLTRFYNQGAEIFICRNIAVYDTILFLIGDVIPISF
jgi:hypothetical protein